MDKALFRLFIIFMALGFSNMALAQESGFPGEGEEQSSEPQYQEEDYVVRESGMIRPEGISTQTSAEKKSEIASPETAKKINGAPAKTPSNSEGRQKESSHTLDSKAEDESVLTYNFLYYLIQKFKFDTVE